jgi:hypothetical protein
MNNFNKLNVDKIFYKNNRKYIVNILLLVIVSIVLFLIGFFWTTNPSEYVYWFLPNKYFVFFVGFLSFILSLFVFIIFLFSILNKEFFIKIDRNGLFVGTMPYENKLVKWSDIIDIQIIEKNKNKFLKINIKNIKNYREKGIRQILFKLSVFLNDTPFLIHTGSINVSIDKLKIAIEKALKVYGNIK